ncbi:MAG: clostripain-related cysteine peptidase [Anaerolineae bacterium]
MNDDQSWKILFFVCGDASDRLGPGQDGIDLSPLLPSGPSDATVLVQARLGVHQPALRLALLPGEALATPVGSVAAAADSPAERDSFVTWALRAYPTRHTLLVLTDCPPSQAGSPAEQSAMFSIAGPADDPVYWPLSEAGLGEMIDQFATRGLGSWLASLASSLAGRLSALRPTPQPPQPSTPKEPPPMSDKREWTILLYMAGDNGATFQSKYGKFSLMAEMTSVGISDIGEVETVGTTDQVAVLAQLDTLPSKDPLAKELGIAAGGTYRLEIHKGRTALQNIVEVLPDVNTGDPAELARFIVWGMNRCPAKHTMLVLWNHGLGWKDDDIYAKVRGMSRSAAQGRGKRGSNAAMFRSTAKSINRRANRAKNELVARHPVRRQLHGLPDQQGDEPGAASGRVRRGPRRRGRDLQRQGAAGSDDDLGQRRGAAPSEHHRHGRLPDGDDRGAVPGAQVRRFHGGLAGG